jgi:molecular chaperone GrpE (heat shock protein)
MADTTVSSDEFATAMQQLSAEASKTLPTQTKPAHELSIGEPNSSEVPRQADALAVRIQDLEKALSVRFDTLTNAISASKPVDLAGQLKKLDEALAALRDNESVNQQLFDSLHSELRKYRDNFVHESLQKPFIHDLVMLYDDLSSLCEQLRAAAEEKGTREHVAQWRDNLENAIHSLVEILHRFEVREVESKENVDLAIHRVVSYEPAEFPEDDGRILMRLKRGFLWRGKLIRPEEVIAKRFR